jgi:2-methylfumaryl-CoA hydratase
VFFFEDYTAGERVLHVDGMTVNASDHMGFTRLYQNSARVHFDALLMNQRPLVYGGYPLSVGYAQGFNGFENRIGIAAINAGTHANPVYQGDTLFAFTDVVETTPLSAALGALRLRMIVVKNENPATADGFTAQKRNPVTGKDEYTERVVLDLDYWELMARRRT